MYGSHGVCHEFGVFAVVPTCRCISARHGTNRTEERGQYPFISLPALSTSCMSTDSLCAVIAAWLNGSSILASAVEEVVVAQGPVRWAAAVISTSVVVSCWCFRRSYSCWQCCVIASVSVAVDICLPC